MKAVATTSTFATNTKLLLPFLGLLSIGKLSTGFQPLNIPLSIRSSSVVQSASTSTSTATSTSTHVAFTSQPCQVYIEDTDAYGVMYNSNYLRAYERLLYQQDEILADGDWWIQSVADQRFKGSPPLGGTFVVEGELVDRTDQREIWKCQMVSMGDKPIVYNSAVLTIASNTQQSTPPPFASDESEGSMASQTYQPFRDEFDPTLPNRIPLRNALNLFERARSDYLGGPDSLRKMQEEDGIVWVVTRIDDCEHCHLDQDQVKCTPDHPLTVQTNFVARRRGTVVEAQQVLLTHEGVRVAQGIVTIMALDANSRRPAKRIPDSALEKLLGGSPKIDQPQQLQQQQQQQQTEEQKKEIEASMDRKKQ